MSIMTVRYSPFLASSGIFFGGGMTKPQEKIDARKGIRRARILEIALGAFLRDGYAATSMSRIAAAVGGSKATLYSYFPSKKELFFAVVDAESSKTLKHLYDLEGLEGSAREKLTAFCRRSLTLLLSEDCVAFYRLIVAESARFPEVGRGCYELSFRRGVGILADFLAQGVAAGVFRQANVEQAAEFLFGLGIGRLHRLRMWGVAETFTHEEIEMEIKVMANSFLAVYGNEALAAEARTFTGL